MAEQPTFSAERALSFGPFSLFPARQLLLEGDKPVRLGSRAFDILTALVEHAGELVSKNDLIARVWSTTFVDDNTLRVHVASLRKALGDGQPGRRYLANIPGRGYRFVAPVELSRPNEQPLHQGTPPARTHNLPLSQARALGRAETILSLKDQLPQRRFITIVGTGGIGKTTVALAVAEMLLPAYEDGVRFVDLAPLDDPQLVPNALGAALGLTVQSESAILQLTAFLRDKQMLVVLDSCEHVAEAAATLAEQLFAGAPGIHILATSREPLRAGGEHVRRLSSLETPARSTDLTAADALAFPTVRLFVERAAANSDGFELSDPDAPIVADICRKLGGVPLAIELAAARVDAFGIRQLAVLLDDRFRILRQGKRTAQPRHQSLTATLDWSYEFLAEVERVVLRRLSVFAGAFTLESAIAVAGDDNTDVVEGVANLVAKSLISADVSGSIVQYRLLDTTRAYAQQKLTESGKFEDYVRRHARHHFDWFKRAQAHWPARSSGARWLEDNGRGIDDVRSALNWAFSPDGDAMFGVALTIASLPLWLELSLVHECRAHIERALASQALQPTHSERDALELRLVHGLVLPQATRFLVRDERSFDETLALAERLADREAQLRALNQWSSYCLNVGNFREALVLGEKYIKLADDNGLAHLRLLGDIRVGFALHYLGDFTGALRHIDTIVNQSVSSSQRSLYAYRLVTRHIYSSILWLRGLPEQAVHSVHVGLVEGHATNNALMLSNCLAQAACPIALYVGDLAEAERSIRMLLDCSAKSALNTWNALGRCFQGRLLLAKGDLTGLPILRSAVNWLREAGFALHFAISLGALAEGLTAAGQLVEAREAIDEALKSAERNEEHWCMPELLRIKGELLRLDGSATGHGATEDHFQQALDWARRQGALSLELRAAMSLTKLWRQNGRTAEAYELLGAVYDRFTEGFDTIDLRTAATLLNEFRARLG